MLSQYGFSISGIASETSSSLITMVIVVLIVETNVLLPKSSSSGVHHCSQQHFQQLPEPILICKSPSRCLVSLKSFIQ